MWQTELILIIELPCFCIIPSSYKSRGSQTPPTWDYWTQALFELSPHSSPLRQRGSHIIKSCSLEISHIARFLLYPLVAWGWFPDTSCFVFSVWLCDPTTHSLVSSAAQTDCMILSSFKLWMPLIQRKPRSKGGRRCRSYLAHR